MSHKPVTIKYGSITKGRQTFQFDLGKLFSLFDNSLYQSCPSNIVLTSQMYIITFSFQLTQQKTRWGRWTTHGTSMIPTPKAESRQSYSGIIQGRCNGTCLPSPNLFGDVFICTIDGFQSDFLSLTNKIIIKFLPQQIKTSFFLSC